ncbi:MAG: ABC transporter substrate-binding protein [Patescibacteria group bacterium]
MVFNTNPFRLAILVCIRYLNRYKKGAFLGVILFVFLIFLQYKFNLFYETNAVRIGIIGTYQEHDIPIEVARLLSNSLVESDPTGKIVPKLVKGWETSSDATFFKFKLKEDLLWEDGTPVKSDDLSFNIPDVEVSAKEREVHFKLKDAYSPFPSLLTKPIFKKNTHIGLGPYRITKIEKSRIFITKLTLESKDPPGGGQGKNLPKVYIRFYPNEKVAQSGFNLGEVQVLLGFPNVSFVSENPKAKIFQKNDFGKIVTIIYSIKDSLLSNRSLRQALSFQAPEISGFEVANNPYPKSSWAYDKDSKDYLNDPTEAKVAIKRAEDAIDTVKLKEDFILTTTPNLEETSKKIVAAWKELGINAKIRIESGIPQNFQILLITQSIPYDPDQYFLWHSTQQNSNLSKYSSARVDKDLEDGRKTAKLEERKEKYFDFQKTLLEDSPATFLYFPKYNIVYLKKVEGHLNKLLPLQFPN